MLGVYLSFFMDIAISSKRYTVTTLCLLQSADVETFGLEFCLKKPMEELKNLVLTGIYDPITKRNIQFRIVCCLGRGIQKKTIKFSCLILLYIFPFQIKCRSASAGGHLFDEF